MENKTFPRFNLVKNYEKAQLEVWRVVSEHDAIEEDQLVAHAQYRLLENSDGRSFIRDKWWKRFLVDIGDGRVMP